MRLRFSSAVLALLGASLIGSAAIAQDGSADASLTKNVAALDAKVFGAYNRCDMAAFGSFFSPDVEFYHDKGGATFDRQTVIANTQKYICHKVRRELLPASLRVYPIKDFGAIEEGEHRFCQLPNGACEGSAKFLMIWQNKNGHWLLTRVVSYGHRALSAAEKAGLNSRRARH